MDVWECRPLFSCARKCFHCVWRIGTSWWQVSAILPCIILWPPCDHLLTSLWAACDNLVTRAQGILSSLPCDILVRDHTIQYVQWTLPLKLLPPSAENFHPIMATAGGGEARGAGLGSEEILMHILSVWLHTVNSNWTGRVLQFWDTLGDTLRM